MALAVGREVEGKKGERLSGDSYRSGLLLGQGALHTLVFRVEERRQRTDDSPSPRYAVRNAWPDNNESAKVNEVMIC